MGTAVQFIPRPVVVGFTNGIAVIIASTHGQQPGGSIPRFLPGLAEEGHEAGDGAPHLGAKDCGDHSSRLEEKSPFRRGTTEAASSLSVSDRDSVPSLGDHPWRWPVGFFLRRSDRRRISTQLVGDWWCFGMTEHNPRISFAACLPTASSPSCVPFRRAPCWMVGTSVATRARHVSWNW